MTRRVAEVGERLDIGVAAIAAAVEGQDENRLRRSPAPGEWSALQFLGHVAELVPFWADRARRVADGSLEPGSYDRTPEELAARLRAVAEADGAGADALVARLRAGAREAAAVLRSIPDEGWARTALWAEGGRVQTVAEIVEQRILRHVEQHARQIEAALAS